MTAIVRTFIGPPINSLTLAALDRIENAMQLDSKKKKKKTAYKHDDVVFIFYGEKYLTIIINKAPEYSPYYAIGQHIPKYINAMKLRYTKFLFGEMNTTGSVPFNATETSLLRSKQEEFKYANYDDMQSGDNYFDMQKDISGVITGADGYTNPDGLITTSIVTGGGNWLPDGDAVENLFNFLYTAQQYFNTVRGEVSQSYGLLTIRREHIYSIFYNLVAHLDESITFYDFSGSDTSGLFTNDNYVVDVATDFFAVQSNSVQNWFNLPYYLWQDIFHRQVGTTAITASLLDYIDICRSITLRRNISDLIKISVDQFVTVTDPDNPQFGQININIPGFGIIPFNIHFDSWFISVAPGDTLLRINDTLADLTFTLASSSTRTLAEVAAIQETLVQGPSNSTITTHNDFTPQVGDIVHVKSLEGWVTYNNGVLLLPNFNFYVTDFIFDTTAVPLTSGDAYEDRFYGFDANFTQLYVGMFDRIDGGSVFSESGGNHILTNFIDTYSQQYGVTLTDQGVQPASFPSYTMAITDSTHTINEDAQYGLTSYSGAWLFNETIIPWTGQRVWLWNSSIGTYYSISHSQHVNEYPIGNQQLREVFVIFYSLQGETYQYQWNAYFGKRDVSLRKSNSIITDTFALTTTFPDPPLNPNTFKSISGSLYTTLGLYPSTGEIQRWRADNAGRGNIPISNSVTVASSPTFRNIISSNSHSENIGIHGLNGLTMENSFKGVGTYAATIWATGGHHALSSLINGHTITVYLLDETLNVIEYCSVIYSSTLSSVINQYVFLFREIMQIIATHHDSKLALHLRSGGNINTFIPELDEFGDYLYKISTANLNLLASYYVKKQAADVQLADVLHNGFMSYQMLSTFLKSQRFMDSYYIIKNTIQE